jgi:hypothetical protein
MVTSFGMNPVNGGRPPNDRRRIMTAKCNIRFLAAILFRCLTE